MWKVDPTYNVAFGDPLVRITFDFEEQDRQLTKFMADKWEAILKEMGADPETSVVNNYSQMWDVENLFVVGASSFPQNAGYNSTGTVGALSYRAAEGILKYMEKGGSLI